MHQGLDLVSVIMPTYNSARFLPQAVASVRAQTFGHWELLISVDPKSSDDTAAIAENLAAGDRRVRVFYPKGPGVAAARNAGLENARGRYLAFLDSDDLWLPCKLSQQLRRMRESDSGFSCTRYRRFAGSNLDGGREGHLIVLPDQITYQRLLQQNCILLSSVILDRHAHPEVAFRDVGCEDFDLWLRLLRPGGWCLGVQQDLLRYRIVRGSRGSNKWQSLRETWEVFRHSAGLSAVRSSAIMMPFLARNLVKYARF
jgi:teichuronic acid biosynthesis glycosyltransferase TuaG